MKHILLSWPSVIVVKSRLVVSTKLQYKQIKRVVANLSTKDNIGGFGDRTVDGRPDDMWKDQRRRWRHHNTKCRLRWNWRTQRTSWKRTTRPQGICTKANEESGRDYNHRWPERNEMFGGRDGKQKEPMAKDWSQNTTFTLGKAPRKQKETTVYILNNLSHPSILRSFYGSMTPSGDCEINLSLEGLVRNHFYSSIPQTLFWPKCSEPIFW